MLIDQIKQDQLTARKNKNVIASSLLTTLLAEASIVGKNQNRQSTDQEVVAVVKKFIKNNTDFISNINDQHQEYTKLVAEKAILEAYLPTQLSEDDLKTLVITYKTENLNVNVGSVMKYMKENYDGQYDGKTLSTIVKEILT